MSRSGWLSMFESDMLRSYNDSRVCQGHAFKTAIKDHGLYNTENTLSKSPWTIQPAPLLVGFRAQLCSSRVDVTTYDHQSDAGSMAPPVEVFMAINDINSSCRWGASEGGCNDTRRITAVWVSQFGSLHFLQRGAYFSIYVITPLQIL